MKQFIDTNFDDIININPKYDQQSIKRNCTNNVTKVGLQIKKCIDRCKMDGFFLKRKNSVTADESFEIIFQATYIQLFLMMYLAYINELVVIQIDDYFGINCRKQK